MANNSNMTNWLYGRDENLAKIEISVQAVIFFLAIFGNGLVLVLLSCRRKKLSRMNLLILHLAIADLFVALFNILPQLIWDVTFRFKGGLYLCKAVKYCQVVAMYASSYVLLTTALDRYLVICHPLRTQTWSDSRVHLLVMTSWVLATIFATPQIFIFSMREVAAGSEVYDCWGEFWPEWTLQIYITWFTVAVYIIPLLLLAFFYSRICYVVWKSMRNREPKVRLKSVQNNKKKDVKYHRVNSNGSPSFSIRGTDITPPRRHVQKLTRSKMKTVKLTLTVVLCYLVCWAPFFVAQMWSAWDTNAPFEADAMAIILLLASLNSCTNPWIYFVFANISGYWRRWCGHRNEGPASKSQSSCGECNLRSHDFSLTYENTYSTRLYGTIRGNSFPMRSFKGNIKENFV